MQRFRNPRRRRNRLCRGCQGKRGHRQGSPPIDPQQGGGKQRRLQRREFRRIWSVGNPKKVSRRQIEVQKLPDWEKKKQPNELKRKQYETNAYIYR